MSYVDTTQHEDETPEEARRRRRYELARGWRFKCECERCLADVPEAGEGSEAGDVSVEKDESKTEAAVDRVERGEAGTGGAAARAAEVSDTD